MTETEEETVELLTEWPPPDDEADLSDCHKDEEYQRPQVKRRRVTCDLPTADLSLARWLRRQLPDLRLKYGFDGVKNPKTLLNLSSETEEGRRHLESELRILQQDTRFEVDPKYYYILSTFYDRLHDLEKALEFSLKSLALHNLCPDALSAMRVGDYLEKLRTLNEEEKISIWLYSKLKKEKCMKTQTQPISYDRKVVSLEYCDVSAEQFQGFCKSKVPVLFLNVPNPCKNDWTREFLKSTIGECKFDVKKPVKCSTEWAGLETEGSKLVSDFLESFDGDNSDREYLFDWSLPLHGPALHEDFTVPEIVADNYLTRTSRESLYNQSWPSLFISRAGTNSGLHIDAFGSHFWMYLVSGEKKWTFYPSEAAGSLGPVFPDSLDPVFRPGPLPPVPSYSLSLRPGQLLFVPAGSPHQVENTEDSVAVSGNFVNQTNIQEALQHFRINALLDPRTEELLKELVRCKFI